MKIESYAHTPAATASLLVTGAGGFVGGAATAALRTAGFGVRAGARGDRAGVTLCDLDRPETLRAALAGVDLVVHAAYGDLAAMPSQTEALLSAMSAAGASRLIYLSSIAVYGEAEGALDESAAPVGRLDAYAAAKRACEALVRDWASAAPQRRAVLLRPGVVYGAGSRFWVDKMGERLRAGALGVPAEGTAPLIHVDDLAATIVGLASRLRSGELAAPSLALNAVGPERPSWGAYFAALAGALDAPTPRHWSKAELAGRQTLAVAAKVWRKLGFPGGRSAALTPTGGEVALFARRADYSTEAARSLGLEARIGLAEGLRRSLVAAARVSR